MISRTYPLSSFYHILTFTMSEAPTGNPMGGDVGNGPAIVGATIGLLIPALLCVSLRCYVRIKFTHKWGWDDSAMVLAAVGGLCPSRQMPASLITIQLCFVVGSSFLIVSVEAGNGQHLRYLQPSQIPDIVKWSTIYATVLFISALFTKCSIAFFILRLIGKTAILKKTKLTLYAIMIAMTIATIILVALWFAVCTPLEKVWNRKVPGTCLPAPVVHSVAYAQSAFAIATDLLLSLAPICIFWSLQISTKRKFGICFLMSLGLAATLTSIMKNIAVTKIRERDFSGRFLRFPRYRQG